MSDGQQQDPNTNAPGAQEPPVDWHDKFLGQKKVAGLQKRVLQANVTAAATGRLIDPGDALKLIDFSDLTADDQGGYDQQAISDKIDALVSAHPYLAQGGNKAGLNGIIPPSGARDGDHSAGQLTRDDLKNMTSRQIEEARRKGRLDDLLAGRQNK